MSATLAIGGLRVAQSGREVLRLTDAYREEAAREMAAALRGVSCKKVRAVSVPGAGATYLSRIQNGDAGNPLFRLASIFVMGRMLGVPKATFQRLINWLQERLDEAYADRPAQTVEEALEADSALDPADDHPRFLAAKGCPVARAQLLELKRRQLATIPTVILALQNAGAR